MKFRNPSDDWKYVGEYRVELASDYISENPFFVVRNNSITVQTGRIERVITLEGYGMELSFEEASLYVPDHSISCILDGKRNFLWKNDRLCGDRADGFFKARKEYKCSFCGRGIEKGQKYYRVCGGGSFDKGMIAGPYCSDSCAGQKSWHLLNY